MESLKKIQEAYYLVCKNQRLEEASQLIREFIADNTTAKLKKGTLSVWNCVSKKAYDGYFQYVCMDNENKVAVASNKHVLFINPDEYKDFGEKERYTVIDKYDTIQGNGYGRYTQLIHKDWRELQVFDKEKITDAIKRAYAYCTLTKTKREYAVIHIGQDVWVKAKYIELLFKVGWENLLCEKSDRYNRQPIVKKWDNKTLLVMPFLVDVEESRYEKIKELGYTMECNFDIELAK